MAQEEIENERKTSKAEKERLNAALKVLSFFPQSIFKTGKKRRGRLMSDEPLQRTTVEPRDNVLMGTLPFQLLLAGVVIDGIQLRNLF